MVICMERGADWHMAQLMPLPLTVSCFSKMQIGFTFLVPAHPGRLWQRAIKRGMYVWLHRWNVGGCDDYYLTDSNLCSIRNASSLYEASWCSRKLWETITWCCDTSHLDSAGNMSRGCYTIRIHTSPFITSHQITRRSLSTRTVPTSQTSYHFSSLDPHETMLAQY